MTMMTMFFNHSFKQVLKGIAVTAVLHNIVSVRIIKYLFSPLRRNVVHIHTAANRPTYAVTVGANWFFRIGENTGNKLVIKSILPTLRNEVHIITNLAAISVQKIHLGPAKCIFVHIQR